MFAAFDPYYKWLGIPPAEQPANLYRLLGITVFESDPEVIESAAEQRMSYLRTFQNGPLGLQSQTLLSEVAEARACLLKAERKLEYDNALSEWLAILVRSVPFQAVSAGRRSAPTALLEGEVFPPPALSCPQGTDCGIVTRTPVDFRPQPFIGLAIRACEVGLANDSHAALRPKGSLTAIERPRRA